MTVNASTQYLLWSALPEVGAFVEFSFHVAAARRLLRARPARDHHALVALACFGMYVASAVHLLMTLRYAAFRVHAAAPLAEAVGQCMSDLVGGKDDCAFRIDWENMDRPWTDPPFAWMTALLLGINIVLSNAVLLGIAWSTSSRRSWTAIISAILLSATTGMAAWSVQYTFGIGHRITDIFISNHYGFYALVLSLLTVTWATSLLVWAAWCTQSTRPDSRAVDRSLFNKYARKLSMALGNSEMLYCGLWFTFVAYKAVDDDNRWEVIQLIGPRLHQAIVWLGSALDTTFIHTMGAFATRLALLKLETNCMDPLDTQHSVQGVVPGFDSKGVEDKGEAAARI
ncbi:hypothetical protein PsYK624_056990 [Phanerochaete sordida]|uniref:Uncharacterized protein n=1 Tax=Phanerochaete sordida TaxID=48140 RepID=A0A9P3G8W2_9APHY|nr:hypothetical protein PsYK624_056990 [Phanerochaete sordida]